MSSKRSALRRCGLVAALICAAATTSLAWAGPDEGRGPPPRERGSSALPRGPAQGAAPGQAPGQHGRAPGGGRWFDGAHGHGRYYPSPGWGVRVLPPRASIVFWGGASYGFFDGVWYSPGAQGYVVVRPPFGIVVGELPAFRTVVTVGGIVYLYADGVYYRQRLEGGYEVVPPPTAVDAAVSSAAADAGRTFVYPQQGQTAEQQASDEYECHRWAVSQSGFDPTAAATATPGAPPARRGDYQRAQLACLEGRGYTVR